MLNLNTEFGPIIQGFIYDGINLKYVRRFVATD